jgi:hypothetical protein
MTVAASTISSSAWVGDERNTDSGMDPVATTTVETSGH